MIFSEALEQLKLGKKLKRKNCISIYGIFVGFKKVFSYEDD